METNHPLDYGRTYTESELVDVYTAWCREQLLPHVSADELAQHDLTEGQRRWLESFRRHWEDWEAWSLAKLVSVAPVTTPEDFQQLGIQPGETGEKNAVLYATWSDGVGGWYERTPDGRFFGTCGRDSEEFKDEASCQAWIYKQCRHL